jgi:hypothetical protein
MYCIFHVLLDAAGAATAISLQDTFRLASLWLCVSSSLTWFGSYPGWRALKLSFPGESNEAARAIPKVSCWYRHPFAVAGIGGILPFLSVFEELGFAMSALWFNTFQYDMSVLLTTILLCSAIFAEVAMAACCYLQLTVGDYKWWWRSF